MIDSLSVKLVSRLKQLIAQGDWGDVWAWLSKNAKSLTKKLVMAWVTLLGLGFIFYIPRAYFEISRSDETEDIFNAAVEIPPGLVDAVTWDPDGPEVLAEMPPLERSKITSMWLRSWEQFPIVAGTGDTKGIETYFSSSAGKAILASVAAEEQLPVYQIAHRLRVTFYAEISEVLGLEAKAVELLRASEVEGQIGWEHVVEAYDVVMKREDGQWRVQHWVRKQQESSWWADPLPPAKDQERVEKVAAGLNKGINYYPQASPFDDFWAQYDPETSAQDLDRIASMGFSSVRIFLPFDEFLGNWVTEEQLLPVLDFLDQADEHELQVVITLFDGRTDHRVQNWNHDRQHLQTVVASLRDHPALLMWDLKNEPDLDIGKNGIEEPMLHAWLRFVGDELRKVDPDTPITIGWSSASAVLRSPMIGDVVSFHYYGPVAELGLLSAAIVGRAGDKPVWLTEYGLPTWNSFFPGGHTENEQAVYVAEVLETAQRLGIDGAMVWTLWDLAKAPVDAGWLPWSAGPQKTLGILRADGSAKPVAAVLSGQSVRQEAPTLGRFNRLRKPFWHMVLVYTFCLVFFILGLRQGPPIKLRRRSKKRFKYGPRLRRLSTG